MYLQHMHPDQIHKAVADNVPVLMAAGVIEYHGPHLPVGTDYIVPEEIVRRVQAKCPCVALPPVSFGPTMTWAGPAEDGNIDFDPTVSHLYVREIFRQLLKIGFRRIYVMQYHQGDGAQVLGIRLAARECMDEITAQWVPGWGRLDSSQWPLANPFNMIQVLSINARERYNGPDGPMNIGHASRGETQLVMGVNEALVDMKKLDGLPFKKPEWLMNTHLAKPEDGRNWIDFCVDAWVKELSKE